MKKIINKKLYNTETAELIHESCNGLPRSDFRNLHEHLYRSPGGAYFLHGEGGALTDYAVCSRGCCYEGEDIRLLTEDEAIQWLEGNDGDEVLLKRFADQIQEG